MKKSLLLLIFVLIITGCDIKEVNTNDINNNVSILLNEKINLSNRVASGYKYYLPRGMRVIDKTEYNEKLFSQGYTYYLYIDVVSYHFKKERDYEEIKEAYFSKKLNFNERKGYLEITEKKDLYFIEMMFNYAKIEVLVNKEDINKAVINASYILNSLTFNNKIIESKFAADKYDFNEENFNLFEPKRKEGNFLDYVEELDIYEEIEE